MLLWGRMVSDSGSILVIDDHPRIRAGLVRLVEELGHSAVEADSLETGLELLERAPFRLVLLDLLLPGMHGFDGLRVLHDRFSDTPVVVISGTATVELAVACMKRGARDVIPKPFDPDVALELIRAALEPTSATYVRNDNRPERARDAVRRATHSWALSPRQAEVLELLVTGASNRTIADSLKCAESTVEMHVTTLLKKSSTSQRAELVARFWMDLARKLMRVLPCGSVESSPFNLKRPRPDLGPDPDNWDLCSWRCHHSRFVFGRVLPVDVIGARTRARYHDVGIFDGTRGLRGNHY